MSVRIGESVERLRRSIDSLLSLVRLEATLPDEHRESVDYRALLEELADEYRRDPAHAGFHIRTEIDPQVGSAPVVASRWCEMLRNLIDNALVQPPSQREIVLSARRLDGALVTAVRDFGPGISPGNRDKIFRRFFSQRPADRAPGTGLGLSVVSAIVAAHGGRIDVESTPDDGATFVVTLPI